MNQNIDIEEIKLLLADYITGSLNESELKSVKYSIENNTEIRDLYLEMKNVIGFVKKVTYEEPSPQYWNNLLPRIHDKIDVREQGKRIRNPFNLIWKILVPVAAIILIVIIFKLSFSPGNQVTENKVEMNQKIENNKDDAHNKEKLGNLNTEDIKQNSKNLNPEKTSTKKIRVADRKNSVNEKITNDFAQVNKSQDEDSVEKANNLIEEIASADINELSLISGNENDGIDEEIDNEIDKLSSSEKELFLDELTNSNL